MTRSAPRLVVVLSAVLATCVGLVFASAATGGGFTVTPNVADPSCNGGSGVQLPTHGFKSAVIASGLLGDGSTLTSFGQIYPGQAYVDLDAVTAQCAADSQFGNAGMARITIPDGLVSPTKGDSLSTGLWINGITARSDGGALVVGTYRSKWVAAAVTAQGQLDPTFGTNGWAVLPLTGEASQVVQEPSGQIVVGGDNSGGGCCTVNHIAGLTSQGQFDTSFGNDGSVVLPTGEDSGVSALSLLPDGDILAQVEYGNMGCWGVRLAMFTPAGKPVAGFAQHMDSFWKTHSYGAFVGDAYVDGNGVTLIGTGQRPCADGPKVSAPSAHGVIAHFSETGAVVGQVVRFPSKLFGDVRAFKHGANTLLAESTYTDGSYELLKLIGPRGGVVKSFGSNGVIRVGLPWPGAAKEFDLGLFNAEPSPTVLTIVATAAGRQEMAVTRLEV